MSDFYLLNLKICVILLTMHLTVFREEIRDEMMERLKCRKIEVPPEMIELVMCRGFNGLEFLTNARNGTMIYSDWFGALKRKGVVIDVGVLGRGPYEVVLSAFSFPYIEMSHAHALYRGFIPDNLQSDVEKAALNAFWASAVEVLCSHHPFGAAA